MPEIKVDISKEQMDQIVGQAKAEWEKDWTEEKMWKYAETCQTIPIQEYISNFGLAERYRDLKAKPVEELTDHERLLCVLYWMYCGNLWR